MPFIVYVGLALTGAVLAYHGISNQLKSNIAIGLLGVVVGCAMIIVAIA